MKVPHAESDKIFDVRYHSRDTRRALEPVLHGNQYTVTHVTKADMGAVLAELAPEAITLGRRHGSQDPGQEGSNYARVPFLDNTNGGYT